MATVPWQRLSPDRRTLTLSSLDQLRPALLLAEASGWRLLLASCAPGGILVKFSS